jgi:hypothetical protein
MKFMKKVKLFLPCAICAAVIILVASCSKDDGAKGDAGPAGPPGAAGAAGAAGPAGAPGTANVIYSGWIDTATWRPDTVMTGSVVTDTLGYFANISAAKLDLTMLNTGEIKVYINLDSPDDPTVFPVPFNNGAIYIDVAFFLNTIQLYSNGQLTDLPCRYILIPGGTTARTYKSINWANYAEVKAYLGLKD